MVIYSLASINFTSISSTQIPFVELSSLAIKYLALQQVLISTHFISASHNDLLTSEFIAILIAATSSRYFTYPYRYSPFYFRITYKLSTQPSWRQRCKKILFLSYHEASKLHNSKTESLDSLSFFPINSWPGDIRNLFYKSEIGDTDTFKFILFAFGNSLSPHLLLNFLLIKYRNKPGKIPKRIFQIQWIIHSIPEKHTYRITSMSPNQNIAIWMAPLPSEIPGTHLHIFTPSLVYLTNEDIDDMDLCDFTHDTSPTPAAPLINNEFEKEWETVWEVFSELSDNPSDPAIISLTNPSTTHASTSTTHCSTSPSPPTPSLTSIPKPSPAPI